MRIMEIMEAKEIMEERGLKNIGNLTTRKLQSMAKTCMFSGEDTMEGNSEIYYKRSIDGGKSFGKKINLSNSSDDSFDAKIKVWGEDKIGVVYRENNDIFYTSSDNNGESFSSPVNLSNNPETLSSDPTIEIVDGSQVKIVWVEEDVKLDSNSNEIKSGDTNGGISNTKWVDNNPANKQGYKGMGSSAIVPISFENIAQIRTFSPIIRITSIDNPDRSLHSGSAVMLSESTDGGKSFSTPRIVTSDPDLEIHNPVIATTPNGKVYLCYVKGIEDDTDINCNHSNDNDKTFSNSTNVTGDPAYASLSPNLAVLREFRTSYLVRPQGWGRRSS